MSFSQRRNAAKLVPGPVSEVIAKKLFEPHPGDELQRTRIEAGVDKLCDNMIDKGDVPSAKLLFEYAQPQQRNNITLQELAELIQNASDEELAALANMSVGEFRSREAQYLTAGEQGAIEVPNGDTTAEGGQSEG